MILEQKIGFVCAGMKGTRVRRRPKAAGGSFFYLALAVYSKNFMFYNLELFSAHKAAETSPLNL